MLRDSKGRFVKECERPQEWIEIVRNAHLGKKLSRATKDKMSESHKGKTYTIEQRLNYRLSKLGAKNPMYINGKYSRKIYKYIREMNEYKEWRKQVFERDNYTCQECGVRGCYIEAHHTTPFVVLLSEFLDIYSYLDEEKDREKFMMVASKYNKLWNINIGQTLCSVCHNHTKSGRGG